MTKIRSYQKLFLFIGVMILTSSGLSDHENNIEFVRNIEWNTTKYYPELPFRDPGFYEETTGIPVLLASIPLPRDFNKDDFEVNVDPLEWAPFYGNHMVDITEEDIPLKPTFRIVHIRKQPHLEIELVPFRISDNPDNKWDRLVEFSVRLAYTAGTEKSNLKSGLLKYRFASRLNTGNWVKIGTTEKGIHKIPYSQLESWGFSDPAKVQVYGNGGAEVPLANSDVRPDDLPEIGCLHDNNALFFYSPGTWQWIWDDSKNMFIFKKHKYSQMAFFFLTQTDETIKRPDISPLIEETATHSSETYDYLYFHELEAENVLKSGNQWFGEKFNSSITLERSYNIEMPGIVTGKEAIFHTQVLGRSNTANGFDISINDNVKINIPISDITMSDYIGYYARLNDATVPFYPEKSGIDINYKYTNRATSSVGWLDYFIINARGHLTLANGQITFRDRSSTGTGNIASYQISTSEKGIVWDITSPYEPLQMQTQMLGNKLIFKNHASQIREYVAFNTTMSFPTPEFIENTPNQNLHGTQPTEMVIVAPKEFLSQANRLASLHQQHSNLNITVADRDQIYNEFSWGHPDPGAIRSFVKMLYDRAGDNADQAPKLLLLFGDGTYDNRNLNNKPEAPLPTFQSDNSIYQTKTYVTDDFFGFLDDEEGENLQNDRLDIGIGRFPVNTQKQAINAVDKSENYLTSQESGIWKANLTFIGDDGDNNIHMRDADRLAKKVENNHPQFDIKKIYFDAYEATSGAVGKEFPGAKADVQKAISEGTLIFNYTGHGSEVNLAHERIVTRTDVVNWNNKSKLPLFVTATCEFSRFDDHNHTSSGEEVFLNPNGGGIALLSTTRIVYSALNYTLNNAFYNHALKYDENGKPLTFGEIMRLTKIESGSNTNKLNFTLLGDPALQLIYPQNNVKTVALNNQSTEANADTLRALSKNLITANVTDHQGNIIKNFNGTAYVTVFDKALDIKTLGNGGSDRFEYNEFSNALFKGRATVTNGEFNVEFVIPQDIRYNFDEGRISYYALSDDNREASGAFSNLIIGGVSNSVKNDTIGPEIEMYLNHPGFKSGDITGARPMLYANIFDESGINTSGIGIGHNITLIIDGDSNNPLILNGAFSASKDDYQKGTVVFHLPQLGEGKHEITLKIWDNYNNSSSSTLSFRTSDEHGINIRNFSAYPNPVKPGDDVYVTMQTDSPNSLISATIQFITASGAVTGVVKEDFISSGNLIGPFRLPLEKSGWKYSDICLVRIILKTQNGQETSVVAKLLPNL